MENVVFSVDQGDGTRIGSCKKCGSDEFGIDSIYGRAYVYCKNCGEEVLHVNSANS